MRMMTSKSLVESMAAVMIGRSNYLSLHFDVPDFSMSTASELTFGGYQRRAVFWDSVGGATFVQRDQVVFTGLVPPVTVAAIGINEGEIGNDLIGCVLFDEPETFASTEYLLPAKMIKLRFGPA
jgi:hypothetical protein